MLPNSYYIEVAKRVARQLDQLRIDHQMELCTEVPRREFVIEPDRLGVAGRVSAPTSIGSEMSRLDEFGVLPNLTHHVNESAMDCIRRMATADVLVMSRSSFSYLAGILNREGIVFYHPFWHQPLSSWITATSEGAFDESGLMKALSAS
jgi:hypothetical protein